MLLITLISLINSKIVNLPSMKLVDMILLSMAVVFVIIGIYETMTRGIGHAYWSVMLSIFFFFIYTYRKKK